MNLKSIFLPTDQVTYLKNKRKYDLLQQPNKTLISGFSEHVQNEVHLLSVCSHLFRQLYEDLNAFQKL